MDASQSSSDNTPPSHPEVQPGERPTRPSDGGASTLDGQIAEPSLYKQLKTTYEQSHWTGGGPIPLTQCE
jgi:hypothetical protein